MARSKQKVPMPIPWPVFNEMDGMYRHRVSELLLMLGATKIDIWFQQMRWLMVSELPLGATVRFMFIQMCTLLIASMLTGGE